jgi:hypothetical protein
MMHLIGCYLLLVAIPALSFRPSQNRPRYLLHHHDIVAWKVQPSSVSIAIAMGERNEGEVEVEAIATSRTSGLDASYTRPMLAKNVTSIATDMATSSSSSTAAATNPSQASAAMATASDQTTSPGYLDWLTRAYSKVVRSLSGGKSSPTAKDAAPSRQINTKIAIIGAGIAGLVCATELLRNGIKDFVVIDSENGKLC